ncbi:Uracil-DNA glycosylase [Sinobacterium norvegicum]|uniref:Uracil-DNA glycosylase n=1 Tax=Sinobacterium norvegicum TaxID=1641715 RepID=A0ABM9AJF1_9GAMM|nr:uracil-DNA glycosylase [Sinobacterium norvegicum]CAH0993357.1 Uracil-DNA glycosylase [Sinobacterium norvegicum]
MNLKALTEELDSSWQRVINPELAQDYMVALQKTLAQRQRQATVFPDNAAIFNAFKGLPMNEVKVVILGQDPYHGAGQAHGLSFSVLPGVKIPPSLRNIYQELADDLGVEAPSHGCLERWQQQGVLLLNNVLTVEQGQAASHKGKGWETLTDAIIEAINQQCQDVVFLLWGAPAQKKAKNVDPRRHKVLMAPHPSPLSAYRGFWGSKPFSQANKYLSQRGRDAIDWQL